MVYVRERHAMCGEPTRLLNSFRSFGIEAGDTTPDGNFSIEVVRCIGACGLGPVVTINDTVYTRMKADKVKAVITSLIKQAEGGG